MSKHTAGPWGIIIGDAGPIVFSGQKSNMVAHCIKAWSSEERMANARLIAAAPDLLEALKAMFDATTDNEIRGADGSPIERARAAIAKATGETT